MNIIITEQQFHDLVQKCVTEGVYVNGVRGNKATLSYGKGMTRHAGNLMAQDMIKTDKMDANNSDTYLVPLKGGIVSYNITSISGQEVMHYFKNYWDHKKAEVVMKNAEGEKESYELQMEKREFNEFLMQFINKVSFVVKHYLSNNNVGEIAKISIYPVPSSSNFNIKMSEELLGMSIGGLQIQVIDQNLFKKDVSNIERDNDFINKNKEYFDASLSNRLNKSATAYVDTAINKSHAIEKFGKYIDEVNKCAMKLLHDLNNYLNGVSKGSPKTLNSIIYDYKYYCDIMDDSVKQCHYNDVARDVEDASLFFNTIASKKKYSKGASVEKRTDFIWNLVKNSPLIRGKVSPITGKPYKKRDVVLWDYAPFKMKNLSNGVRMGLKNFFSINTEVLQKEIQRINGTLFIIFDDNISGGATLSDICMQAKNAGIKNILPITFGKMGVKWQMGTVALNRPTDKNGNWGSFNY
jgi:hypothetical protein